MKKVYSLNLEKELIDKMDVLRNGIPRSPYVNKILEQWLKKKRGKK